MTETLLSFLASTTAATQPATQATGNGAAVGWEATVHALSITGIGMLTILLVMGIFGALIVAIGRLFPDANDDLAEDAT